MVDFTCENISLKEIIKCTLGLSSSDYKIFTYFYNNKIKNYKSEDLSNTLNLDISTIQRSLKNLYEKNIIKRKKKCIHKRGYNFVYKRYSKSHIQKTIQKNIDHWNKKVKSKIKKL